MATAEQRAALVERVARAIASAQRCEVTMQPRQQDLRAADAVLAALAGRLLPVETRRVYAEPGGDADDAMEAAERSLREWRETIVASGVENSAEGARWYVDVAAPSLLPPGAVAVPCDALTTLVHAAIRHRDAVSWRATDPVDSNEAGRLAFAAQITAAIDAARDALALEAR